MINPIDDDLALIITLVLVIVISAIAVFSLKPTRTIDDKKLLEYGYAEYNKATGEFQLVEPKKKEVKNVGK